MCCVDGCNNKKIFAKGMCAKHYRQMYKYGKIFKYCWNDKINHIEYYDDYAEIFLISKETKLLLKLLLI